MTDPTKTTPEEKREQPKGLAQAIREAKGLVTAIVLALSGFAWNKIEACVDRDFNQNVQKSGYEVLQAQITEMRHEINECVIGLEVWKRTSGAESSDRVREDKPASASATSAHPTKGKRKAGGERGPASVAMDEAAEMVSGVADEVAAEMEDETPPPSFDDIVQHVKQKSEPLNMEQWQQEVQMAAPPRPQTQEQYQDEP